MVSNYSNFVLLLWVGFTLGQWNLILFVVSGIIMVRPPRLGEAYHIERALAARQGILRYPCGCEKCHGFKTQLVLTVEKHHRKYGRDITLDEPLLVSFLLLCSYNVSYMFNHWSLYGGFPSPCSPLFIWTIDEVENITLLGSHPFTIHYLEDFSTLYSKSDVGHSCAPQHKMDQ